MYSPVPVSSKYNLCPASILASPLTCNLTLGAVVPIPTLPALIKELLVPPSK